MKKPKFSSCFKSGNVLLLMSKLISCLFTKSFFSCNTTLASKLKVFLLRFSLQVLPIWHHFIIRMFNTLLNGIQSSDFAWNIKANMENLNCFLTKNTPNEHKIFFEWKLSPVWVKKFFDQRESNFLLTFDFVWLKILKCQIYSFF